MIISKNDIDKILKLVRLDSDEKSKFEMEEKIVEIGNDFSLFEEIRIEGEMMFSPTQFIKKNIRSKNELELKTKREDIIKNAPHSEGDFITFLQEDKNE